MVQTQILNKILHTKSVDIVFENDLTESHFGEYAREYNFIMEHYKKYGNVPDIATFLDAFNEFDLTEVSESDAYLIDKIREDYQYRVLVPILNKAAELAQSNSVDSVDFLKTELPQLSVIDAAEGVDIIKHANQRYEEYLQKKNSTDPWMRPTGFKELDDDIGGIAPYEEFILIFARTNQGKSFVACKMAEHNWKYGANVGYISPEMSANAIGYRVDTLNEHFSNFALYTGRDVPEYEQYINDLMLNQKNSFVVATPLDFNKKITVQKLKKFIIRHKLDILFIDGITYLTDERYKRGDNKTTSLTNISEDLMELSCEMRIPVIAVAQANRAGVDDNGGVPSLESIRDSDGMAHNATKVIALRQHNNKLKMKILKNRNGKVGTELCYDWQIDTGTFEYNPSPEEFSDTERVESRYNRESSGVRDMDSQQPLTRRTTTVLPF